MKQFISGITRMLIAMLSLPAVTQAADLPGTLVPYHDFPSAYVAPRNVTVWLPPSYAKGRRRYPVIYMHDGQNLFDPATSYGGTTWGVAETLVALHKDVIVVGIWNTKLRGREYFPQKVFDQLTPEQQANAETTHGGKPVSDAYLKFIVTELKPYINKTYRTRTTAADTSIAGSSMGGLISLYAMAEYPDVFGQAACLSIHWPMADPRKADPIAITNAWTAYLKTSKWHPGTNRLYWDHGTVNLDSFYAPYAERMDTIMPTLGWHRDQDFISRVFEGGDHNESAWRARLDVPFAFLLTSKR